MTPKERNGREEESERNGREEESETLKKWNNRESCSFGAQLNRKNNIIIIIIISHVRKYSIVEGVMRKF